MPKPPITCADHMGVPRHAQDRPVQVWILGHGVDQALLERAGDARRAADQLDAAVGALVVGAETTAAEQLIAHGVDKVCVVASPLGLWSAVATAAAVLLEHPVRVVLASGDGAGREWAALLAVQLGWPLVSPALMVQVRQHDLELTGLDHSGRLARKIRLRARACRDSHPTARSSRSAAGRCCSPGRNCPAGGCAPTGKGDAGVHYSS